MGGVKIVAFLFPAFLIPHFSQKMGSVMQRKTIPQIDLIGVDYIAQVKQVATACNHIRL